MIEENWLLDLPSFLPEYEDGMNYGYKNKPGKNLETLLRETSNNHCMYCYSLLKNDRVNIGHLEHSIEKKLDEESFLQEAIEIKELCKKYNVPFVINDNVDIAIKMDADGVHVGQSDMEAGDVRKKLGPDKIIGVSAQTVEQAILAEKHGADYLGVGAVFPTGSKDDAEDVPFETLKAICEAVSIPVIAIGGITKDNVKELAGSGICGIAVISAIFASKDIEAATKELKVNTIKAVK